MSQPQPGQQPYPPQHPQAPQYAPPQPPKKKSKAKVILGILGGFVVLVIIAAVVSPSRPAGTTATPTLTQPAATQPPAVQQQPAAPATIVVVYEVTGAGMANNISFNTDGVASISQENNVKLPWTKTLEMTKGKAFSATIVAQAGEGTPEIKAKITANGQVLKEEKSTGQFAVVTVSGELFSIK